MDIALCEGLFGPEAVGPAIDGVHSERLQDAVADVVLGQTREVLYASAASTGDDAGALLQAHDALSALQAAPPGDRRALVLHPTFRYWLQAMRRSCRGGDPARHGRFLAELPGLLLATVAAHWARTRTWQTRADEQGGLRCPPFGCHVELGPERAGQSLQATLEADRVILECDDGLIVQIPLEELTAGADEDPASVEVHGYEVRRVPQLAGRSVELSARDPWLRVVLTGTNQRTTGTRFFGAGTSLYEREPDPARFEAALRLIEAYWPEAVLDLARFTHVVVPLDTRSLGEGEHHFAFTVSSRQGAIYVGAASPESMVEMLLHENAHVKLRQLQVLDTLLVDPLDESTKVDVPWRSDPRPIPGVFEGLYVFSHVAEFERRRMRAGGAPPERLRRLVGDLRYTTRVLETHARLTEGGVRFFAAAKRWVDDLAADASMG